MSGNRPTKKMTGGHGFLRGERNRQPEAKNSKKWHVTDKENLSVQDFTKLRDQRIQEAIIKNKELHTKRSDEELKKILDSSKKGSPRYERVIIGAGIAGTLVFAEIPQSSREKVLVINDISVPNSWLRGGEDRLMAQPQAIQTPSMLGIQSGDYLLDKDEDVLTNPYGYVRMSHFSKALIENQNDLNMPIVNLRAGKIQAKNQVGSDTIWEHNDSPYRIPLYQEESKEPILYVYTDKIDLCQGLGHVRKLERSQIDAKIEDKLIKDGRLLYDPQDPSKLKDNVVFYGASGGCASVIAEVEQARAQGKTVPKIQGWYTRRVGDFKNRDAMRGVNRLIGDMLDVEKAASGGSTIKMHDGMPIQSVNENVDGTLTVVVGLTQKESEKIVCSQLVVSIAQTSIDLTSDLDVEFKQCFYEEVPIGVVSEDMDIVAWGASGTNISFLKEPTLEQVSEFTDLLIKDAKTLPFETQGAPTVFSAARKIELMTKFLKERGKFIASNTSEDVPAKKLALPNINAATKIALIKVMMDIDEQVDQKKCEEVAGAIIKARSTPSTRYLKNPGGIHSLQDIQKVFDRVGEVPVSIQKALREYYFPFEAIINSIPEKKLSAILKGCCRKHQCDVKDVGRIAKEITEMRSEDVLNKERFSEFLEKQLPALVVKDVIEYFFSPEKAVVPRFKNG